MDASELARWTRFAAKGGIGKCTAVLDCVAESAEDLMFLKEDEITVLMQIPDRSNLYLGYCEGVVGRFNGNDVKFHARLKKPIMTKRSSVSNQAKSPSPTSGGHTPSPKPSSDYSGSHTHRRVVTLTPRGSMDLLGSGISVPHASSPEIRQEQPSRQPATNGSTSMPSTPPFGSPTQLLRFQTMQLGAPGDGRDLALPSPAFEEMQIGTPSVLAAPVHVSSSSTSSTSTLVEPPVRTSPTSPPRRRTSNTSPSHNTASISVPSPNSTFLASSIHSPPPPILAPLASAQFSPQSAAHTVHPLPPTPPAESPAITPPASVPSTPPRKTAPAPLDTPTPIAKHDYHSTPPDTSTSSAFDTSTTTTFARVLSDPDSDMEVGIGLTLLQGLANGDDGAWGDLGGDSDSDGDDEELERIRREGRAGLEREAEEDRTSGGPGINKRNSSASSASSRYSRPGSSASESDVDGLRYEDTETGHGSVETHEQHHTSNHNDSVVNSPVSPMFFPAPAARSPQEMTFPPVAPLSPSRKGKSGGQYEFPAPPTHTHTYSLTQESLHDLASLEHDRERRPSLAPSAGSTSDWEGASDIYDDYRYSRFSMGGVSVASGSRVRRMSTASGKSVGARSVGGISTKSGFGGRRMSVGSSKAGTSVVTGDYPVFVDNPEARSRVDSATSQGGSRPSGDGYGRPSVESLIRARAGSSAAPEQPPAVPSITEHGVPLGGTSRTSQQNHQDIDHLIVRSQRHARNESLGGSESDASVYTQSSVGGGSVRSAIIPPPPHPVPIPQLPSTSSGSASSSARNSGGNMASSGNRPAPLNLAAPNLTNQTTGPMSPPASAQDARFQLLHTTWGSPIPSPGQDSNFSGTGYTGTSEGFTGRGYTTPPSATYFQGAGGLDALSRALSGGGDSSATGGAASALRQRIEVDRRPSPITATGDSHHEDGPGRRIVVEDDDEPHSHMTSAPSSPAEANGTFKTVIQDSPSPEPELVSRQRLGSLSVANRTPTPPEGRKGSKDDLIDVEPPSPMIPSIPQPTPPTPTPASTSSLPAVPASYTPPPNSHLRPSLSELRGGQPGQPDQGQRRSLFLPHPNAPKPPSAHSPGPMYIAQQQPPPPTQQQIRGGVIPIIKMALAGGGMGQGRPGITGRGPTIYGRTMEDLSASNGPVPMVFTTDPPPATAPPGAPVRIYAPSPRVPSSPIRGSFGMALEAEREGPGISADGGDASTDHRSSGVIPRANFFPKAGGVRPRSRSFSGFNSTTAEVPLPLQRSREEGSQPIEMPSAMEVKESLGPLMPTTPSPSSPGKHSPKPSPLRSSSLALPQNNSAGPGAMRGMKPPSSPLASGFSLPSVPPSPTTSVGSNRPTHLLRNANSHSNLSDSSSSRQVPMARSTLSGGDSSTSLPSVSSQQPTGDVNSTSPVPRSRPSVDTDALSIRSNRSGTTTQPTVVRQNSLRTKLSLPNLRRTIGRQDDSSSVMTGTQGPDGDTMQVQDMDFELVRPNLAQFQAARSSEDSGVMGRETSVDVRQDHFRSASPAVSHNNVPRSPTAPADTTTAWQPMKAPAPPVPVESESSMDAHRQREQKWMSVMAAVLPSQSKKSKKVKKLLFDGVPSSVRYLVWMHLTDGKARCVRDVYARLGARGKVPAFANIERDVQRCFADYPHLQSTQGPVLGLLQAYLTMVPDIQYTTGQLLIIAPEEDAFWIFVSIMDTHLRPYFSSSTVQIEVDAALFSRALESADSTISKKVLVDMGILPVSICRPWFTSLFVGTLPNDYLNRVWDIFLLEGVPFLIRVALALISCLRRQILDSTSEESLLAMFQRPPQSFLPASADAFISLAMSVKLKDDDVRKQRIKMEAQVKRQTQTPRLVSTPGTISLPRS